MSGLVGDEVVVRVAGAGDVAGESCEAGLAVRADVAQQAFAGIGFAAGAEDDHVEHFLIKLLRRLVGEAFADFRRLPRGDAPVGDHRPARAVLAAGRRKKNAHKRESGCTGFALG